MPKRVIITAGGTGGHVYPAQGLAQQLKKSPSPVEVVFMAGGLQTNRYFDRSNFSYKEVACSNLLSKNPLKILRGALNLLKGIYQSYNYMREYRPDVVVGFGSFYTASPLLAAKLLNIPIILHEANSIPGKANKWFAPYVECVGVHFPAASKMLKGKSLEVNLPLREGYLQSTITQADARAYFQLEAETPTLLIFGGSQGAQAINQLIKNCLRIGFQIPIQVIHLTGDKTIIQDLQSLYTQQGIKHCVKPFELSMNMAWKAADFFIGRSGASTIAEAMEFEVPGLLIPYPFAAENHQEKNADFFVDEVKGGLKCLEKELNTEHVIDLIKTEFKENTLKIRQASIKKYKKNPNRLDLCDLVLQVVNKD